MQWQKVLEDLRVEGHFESNSLRLEKTIMAQTMTKETAAFNAFAATLRALLILEA